MLNLKVNGVKGEYELSLPTKLEEIDTSYLKEITDNIEIAQHYSLIATVYHEKLSSIILAANRNKKSNDIAVVPLFVKAGEDSSGIVTKAKIGDNIIIGASDIMIGHHVIAKNNLLNINTILSIVEGDKEIYQKSLAYTEHCYFVEFKLVPNNAIKGIYKGVKYKESPFIKKINK
uniref:Uncharacterized protein n=1 Tax=Geladintestivirus 2 TaxID=3233134 RepID=A0AAU8MKV3_9CAUD